MKLFNFFSQNKRDKTGRRKEQKGFNPCRPPAKVEGFCVVDGTTLFASEAVRDDPDFRNFELFLKHTQAVTNVEFVLQEEIANIKATAVNASPVIFEDSQTWTESAARQFFEAGAQEKASDIHIRVYSRGMFQRAKIYLRVHGQMTFFKEILAENGKKLVQTIYQSLCDEKEATYRPGTFQDGRISENMSALPRGVHGIRVLSGGHTYGTFMTLRLLYDETENIQGALKERLMMLGYSEAQVCQFEHILRRPSGIFLLSGATGSGKSTTLKHIMEILVILRPDQCYYSLEDPPEYPIAGVVQIPVGNGYGDDKDRNGSSDKFAKAIRAAMRADPDVLMVGEVRDSHSAESMINGAQTGHPMLSTIHANSAWSVMNRLSSLVSRDFTDDPMEYLCDPTVMSGTVHQALVLKNCPDCSSPLKGNEHLLPPDMLARINCVVKTPEDYEQIRLSTPDEKCPTCKGFGSIGRTVVAEVVAMDPKMLSLMRHGGVEEARAYWRKHFPEDTLLQHAISKIVRGEVDPREVERRCGQLDMDVLLDDGAIVREEIVQTDYSEQVSKDTPGRGEIARVA